LSNACAQQEYPNIEGATISISQATRGTRPLEWMAITLKSDSVGTDEPLVQIVAE
jgi:hypothetical protein